MIYLYGLLDCAEPPKTEDLKGVTGPVLAHHLDQGWLVYGQSDEGDILPKRRYLLAHTKVQEALMAAGTFLPMQFGMFADDLKQISGLLAENASEIAERFRALEGQVEVGLRIAFPRDAALDATLAGNPRLNKEHARLARMSAPPHFQVAEFGRHLADALDARRGAAQKRLVAALRHHWSDHVVKAPNSDIEVLSVECLLPEAEIEALASGAQDAALQLTDFAGNAEPTVQIVGPAPAFHFASLSLAPRA